MRKEILVLAKSRKHGGYCVAGLEVVTLPDGHKRITHNWVRPVLLESDGGATGALPKAWCDSFRVLDCIVMDVKGLAPDAVQQENWLLVRAPVKGDYSLSQVAWLDGVAANDDLWRDAASHRDDRIGALCAQSAGRSLVLIQPQSLQFQLKLSNTPYGIKKRVLASFVHNGRAYQNISVTDPALDRVFFRQFPKELGVIFTKTLFHSDNYFLTLSLSPRFFDGYHYMIGAAVIDRTGYLNRTYA